MWFFAPPSAWTRFPFADPRRVDVLRDRRRADEADRCDVRVLQDRVDRHFVAVHDVEDAVRDAGLVEQLGDEERGGRVLLGRLQDERVAAGDRRRPHPHGHHRREVERRDPRDDPERLADRVDVDAGRGLLGEVARKRVGIPHACSITSRPRCTSPDRVGEHLAVLGGQDSRDLLAPRVHELADANMMSVRFESETARQSRTPPSAAATAASTSSTEAKSTSPVCAPSAGL